MSTTGQKNTQIMRELKTSRLKKEISSEQKRYTAAKKINRKRRTSVKTEELHKKQSEILKNVKKQSKFFEIVPYKKGMGDSFYKTREWLILRHTVLSCSDGKCAICNQSKNNGAIIQVDHIKPRSRFPELELDINNLQVLCVECNLGKGASYIA